MEVEVVVDAEEAAVEEAVEDALVQEGPVRVAEAAEAAVAVAVIRPGEYRVRSIQVSACMS